MLDLDKIKSAIDDRKFLRAPLTLFRSWRFSWEFEIKPYSGNREGQNLPQLVKNPLRPVLSMLAIDFAAGEARGMKVRAFFKNKVIYLFKMLERQIESLKRYDSNFIELVKSHNRMQEGFIRGCSQNTICYRDLFCELVSAPAAIECGGLLSGQWR